MAPVGACGAQEGKGTCGPGIQRALGAAHSIPPFSPFLFPRSLRSAFLSLFAVYPAPLRVPLLLSHYRLSSRLASPRPSSLLLALLSADSFYAVSSNSLSSTRFCFSRIPPCIRVSASRRARNGFNPDRNYSSESFREISSE